MRRSVGISYRERKTSSCHASAAQKVFERKTPCPPLLSHNNPMVLLDHPHLNKHHHSRLHYIKLYRKLREYSSDIDWMQHMF